MTQAPKPDIPRTSAIRGVERVQRDAAASARVSWSTDARIATTMQSGRRLLAALEQGAEEFILTSLDGTVSARIRLTVAGVHADEERIGTGQVTVDWTRSTVSNGPRWVAVSRTELLLLSAILEGNQRPVSRAELIRRVWPGDSPSVQGRENGLGVCVCSLRKRLAAIGLPEALETVRGHGYRIVL